MSNCKLKETKSALVDAKLSFTRNLKKFLNWE